MNVPARARLVLLVVVVTFLALGGVASGNVRVLPIRGQVIDADTKQPIQGAVVILATTLECPKFTHGANWYDLAPVETTTDRRGRFTLLPPVSLRPCLLGSRSEALTILAPGYIPRSVEESSFVFSDRPFVAAEEFGLKRIRYRPELDRLADLVDAPRTGEKRTAWSGRSVRAGARA